MKDFDMKDFELIKYSLTSKALNIVHFDMEIIGGIPPVSKSRILWTNEFMLMLGFDNKDEFPDAFESLTGRLHPEDNDSVLDAIASHINDRTGKKICDVECRLMVKNGTYRYFRIVMGTLRDEMGTPIMAAGAMEDINEKKLIQQELDEANRISSESLIEAKEIAEKQRLFVIEEHKKLQTILNMLPIGVRIMRTSDGVMLYANEAAVRIFNGKSFEAQGAGLTSERFMPEFQPDGRRSIDVYNEFVQEAAQYVEIQCLRLDGEPFFARFTTCRINYQGEPCSLGVVEDITAEREYQQRLHDVARKEHEANQAKSDFLAKMSHEIRTPMNAIIGMSELALREYMSDAAYEQVFTVKQAGTHLLALINDILDFSKIETGKMEIVHTEYSFSSLANDIISIIRMRLFDSQIRFAVNIDSHIPDSLIGDVTRIRQVLINIMGNAVKYTDSGFVALTISGDFQDEDMIVLSMEVKDSGRGIKKEDLSSLFGEYMQLDLEKNQGLEGVGLGLAISWNLVKAMDGQITVDSEYGEGSTFTFTLPQKISKHDRIAVVENEGNTRVIVCERRSVYSDSIGGTLDNLDVPYTLVTSVPELCDKMSAELCPFVLISYAMFRNDKDIVMKAAGRSRIVLLADFGEAIPEGNWSVLAMPIHAISIANILNGISEDYLYSANTEIISQFSAPDARVLVVDDITTNLKVAEGLLKPYDLTIDLCKSGAEAIEAVKKKSYDLIFMDHRMPDMDGVEATGRIRALGAEDPKYKTLPIIALTANAVSGMKEVFLESGFDGYLSKPIETSKLNSILEKWLKAKYGKRKVPIAQPNESKPASDIQIEGLDIPRGLLHIGGKMELYLETLEVFCDDGYEKTKVIQDCLAVGDISTYTVHIHAMKSAAANIGAIAISDAAKALETAGLSEDKDYIEAHNDDFISSLAKLLDDIKSVLPSREWETHIDMDSFKDDLLKLKSALENMDARLMKTIVDNIKNTTPEKHAETVKSIARSILISEYDEAVELIETIISGEQ